MSQIFRRIIGASKARLQEYFDNADEMLLDQNVMEDLISDLIDKLIRNTNTINTRNDDWIQHFMSLENHDERDAEDQIYAEHAEGPNGFLSVIDRSEIYISRLKKKLRTIQDAPMNLQVNPAPPINGLVNADPHNGPPYQQNGIQVPLVQGVVGNMGMAGQPRGPEVKLPKLSFPKFDGNVIEWRPFFDAFESSVHNNARLSNVDKFNYLRCNLQGEALNAIEGLQISNQNYDVAIDLLKRRFGNKQAVVSAHHSALMSIPVAHENSINLRQVYDQFEKHLRSLETLGENVEQPIYVTMLTSKLPSDVFLQLELLKVDETWTTHALRQSLNRYLNAMEASERQASNKDLLQGQSSAEALLTVHQQPQTGYATTCMFCKRKGHWSDECKKFKTVQARKDALDANCLNCLRHDHRTAQCKFDKKCFHCQKTGHHRSLCYKKFPSGKQYRNEAKERTSNFKKYKSKEVSAVSHNTDSCPTERNDDVVSNSSEAQLLAADCEDVVMQTAQVILENPSDPQRSVKCRIFLDSGSKRTYMSMSLAKGLDLQLGKNEKIALSTFGTDKVFNMNSQRTALNMRAIDGSVIKVHANVIPTITRPLYRAKVNFSLSKSLKNSLQLADSWPNKDELGSIDLLIGNDYYMDIILPERIPIRKGLHLLGSHFGWILSGRFTKNKTQILESISMFCWENRNNVLNSAENLDQDIERFWELETIGIQEDKFHTDDDKALANFKNTVQFKDGRYQVTWPWKDETLKQYLADNYAVAMCRFKSLMRRLTLDKDLHQKYSNIIEDQERKGIIERVQSGKSSNLLYYIPHHPVITPQKATTKVRLVYDASSKKDNTTKSLNDCLCRGHVLLDDLCGLLLRFRLFSVAIVADIEKAFLQVGLQDADKDLTRFLWLRDVTKPISEGNLQIYRFTRVCFGIISSPFLLAVTVKHHLQLMGTDVAKTIASNMYVDNVVTGVNLYKEAVQFYKEAKQIFYKASMNLREWDSNCKDLLSTIPTEDNSKGDVVKVLGLMWNLTEDTLCATGATKIEALVPNVTKRIVMKQIASIYDPLGMYNPITILSKLFLQELWKDKSRGWDDPLSTEAINKWSKIANVLQNAMIPFKRYLGCENSKDTNFELSVFCDASEKAYATAVYLKYTKHGIKESHLIFSKTRLAPIAKDISLPRLELLAVLIGTRCLSFVAEQLRVKIHRKTVFTDSQCVLAWITSSKNLTRFVQNRVNEIKQHTDIQFCFVPTKENPADMPTRGVDVETFANSTLWWNGPTWLQKSEEAWPSVPDVIESHCEDQSKESEPAVQVFELPYKPPFGIQISNFSSFTKLLRITAWCLRFWKNLKKDSNKSGLSTLNTNELSEASNLWFSADQNFFFVDTINALRTTGKSQLKDQLGIQMDNKNVLRCHGRFGYSEIPEDARNLILLHRKSSVTRLIVLSVHKTLLHAGVNQTLNHIRKRYWIPQGRVEIKRILKECGTCKRFNGGPYKLPKMAPFPKERVSSSPPFTYVGLDYFGPLYIKTSQGNTKVWVALFTCMAIRAIHLELVLNLSAEQFLLAFRRYLARRGKPNIVISDNASTFKLSDGVLREARKKVWQSDDVQNYCSNQGIKWKFIIQSAPWMGGFYDRLIGIVKCSLRKSIGKICLTKSQHETVLCETEAVVNSRPLTYIGNQLEDGVALSPSSFLNRNMSNGIPQLNDEESENDPEFFMRLSSAQNLLKMWKKGQVHLDRFWKSWRESYLSTLRERCQSSHKDIRGSATLRPQKGEVVLIHENSPRGCWKLGIIEELITSNDGEVRAAKVRLSNGFITNRSISQLSPMECSISEVYNVTKIDLDENGEKAIQRPKRRTAELAKVRIKEQLNIS